jgi:hypothetical protein
MVAGVTASAGLLGSRLSGVLSALPILGGVLSVFALHREGRNAANAFIAAMIVGTLPCVLFFAVVGAELARGLVWTTYIEATVAAVGAGAVISWVTRARGEEASLVEQAMPVVRRAA